MAVVRDGRLIYVKGFGFRDIAAHERVDAQTRFEIGSVTKQFTAAAILQLKERQKLRLDDSLANYLPSFPHARDLTLRQLLNQVSGLPDYFGVKGSETTFASTQGGLDEVARYAKPPLHFKPGTRYEYSNTNYYVLGRVIEIVSRQPYDAYVRQRLFAPAGMAHSGFISGESKLRDFATPYELRGKSGEAHPAPPILESWAGGAGAIVSTAGDLAAWDIALAGGKIVTHDDYVLMSTPFATSNGAVTAYGMGLAISESHGHKRVSHAGETNGSTTLNATYPDDHVAIIVLENVLGGNTNAVEAAVFEQMMPAGPANGPARGEDPAVRRRALHFIDETLHGSISENEMSPQFQKIATTDVQRGVARRLAPLGAPRAVVFIGKGDRPGATRYTYRAQFARRAITFVIIIDKTTHLLDAMGIGRQ